MLRWMILPVCIFVAAAQDFGPLVWSDEFDGPNIDDTKWEHEITAGGGGVGEQFIYLFILTGSDEASEQI